MFPTLCRKACVAAATLWLASCGLDALFINSLSSEHLQEVNVFTGKVLLDGATVNLILADGQKATLTFSEVKDGSYTIKTPAGTFDDVRVVATQGEAVVSSLIAHADYQQVVTADLDATSQALDLVALAKLTATGYTLKTVSPKVMDRFLTDLRAQVGANGPTDKLVAMVKRILTAADKNGNPDALVFLDPVLTRAYATVTSALRSEWISGKPIDYSGDGAVESSSVAFDIALATVASAVELKVCLDPVLIRVVLTVNMNDGQKDGACRPINRFKWAVNKTGAQMYFVAGIHTDSPIQDKVIDASLGNPGTWSPNTIPMYDDGTHGDEAAGDGIWSISYSLPRGLRIGYKYTWGKSGDGWTGTEEWPGHQRVLEIDDVNADNFVYRTDSFGDEATNKDFVNLNPLTAATGGKVTWTSDMNGDGILDCTEQKADTDGDCKGDTWLTPVGIGPVTVDCP